MSPLLLIRESDLRKKLVILTTHFGTNFSGGSTATCEIFSTIESHFNEVIVVGTQLGKHSFRNFQFLKYESLNRAIKILKSLSEIDHVFYGDFYNSYLYLVAGKPFYFTYHDNWPELKTSSVSNYFKSFFYTNIYNLIFRKALSIITVSEFKRNYISNFTERVYLVRNGYKKGIVKEKDHLKKEYNRVLMVGNIDKRKYQKASPLFDRLLKDSNDRFHVDIYGAIQDKNLAKRLSDYPFVSLKGFMDEIPYESYDLLIHTSVMENLPIVFCEAIYHGVAIVAFDVGGAKEIISNENGILIPGLNTNNMRESLTDILNGQIKFELNKEVLKDYSWERAGEAYLKIMQ